MLEKFKEKHPRLHKHLFTVTTFSKILALSLFIILPFIGFYLGMNYQKNNDLIKINKLKEKAIITQNKNINLEPNEILNNLESELKIKAPIQSTKNWEWFNDSKIRIPLEGSSLGLGTVETKFMGKYGNLKPHDGGSISEAFLLPLQKQIENYFIDNGFTKNEINSYTNTKSNKYYLAFEKGEIKCLITFYPKVEPFTNIFCGKIDQNQVSLRDNLGSALINDEHTIMVVDKLIGNYASGVLWTDQAEYLHWIAVNTNGNWKIIWKGLGTLPCDLTNQYKVPTEIVNQCGLNGG